MVVELMVRLFTVPPVMGGTPMAEQREHILAELLRPLEGEGSGVTAMSERRRITLALQDPTTPPEQRLKLAERLREMNKKLKASLAESGKSNGDPAGGGDST